MARNPDPVRRITRLAATLILASLCQGPVLAQARLSLRELGSRTPPNFTPAHEGEKATVRGVVSATVFQFPGYAMLAIQDDEAGGVLETDAGDSRLDAFRPGDQIEASGTVSARAGMPVLRVDHVAAAGRVSPPQPLTVSLRDLNAFPANLRYLGRLVHTEGRITDFGDTAAGGSIIAGSGAEAYKIFIPSASHQPMLPGIERGDGVAATGVALQYCALRPFDRFFELLAHQDGYTVRRGETRGLFPPLALASALSVVLFISFFLWSRERRLRKQRERLRRTYQLGEEILGASSAAAILKRISEVLPTILGVTRVQLYCHNRAGKTLDAAPREGEQAVSIPLSSRPGGAQAGAVACFHYRTLLAIPDVSRSPFPIAADAVQGAPLSLLFAPMQAQGEVMGVLELDQDDRIRDFTPDEQALAQHLGNQIGVALRLLDQRSVQEQLFRTEKLAAVGRLISGVVNELETPLASIAELASKVLPKCRGGPAEREVAAISAEAQKAAAMVARLVSFAGSEQVEARSISITALLRSLIDFREGDWKASGIKFNDLISREQLNVLGSQGQLEQVFLNLLVHAEQSLAEAPQKAITVRTSVLARRLLVEISFSAPPGSRNAEETAGVLGVTRGVVVGHGGEVRLIEKANENPRFEVELPAARDRAAAARESGQPRTAERRLTVLVIEPDEAASRQLLGMLSTRGCRVVPAGSSDTALELAHRMRFDAAFCSVHAPGLNWVELSERMQTRTGAFVLLSDRYDAELTADFEGDCRFVLPKPLHEPELDRVLQAIERQPAVKA